MASNKRYLCLLVFQIILVPLFIVFVKYDGDNEYAIKGYEDVHVMIYIGFGFLMTFLKKYCYGALGINWLLAALVAQWSIITQGLCHLKDMTIPINKKVILEADVMTATVLITFGVLLGRASVGQLLFISVVEAAVGSGNLYLLESVLQIADAGGSVAIHTYGAFFGIGVSTAWIQKKSAGGTPEQGSAQEGHPLEGPNYVSDVTSMIGSIFLFIYWPSFNAGLTSSPAEYQRAICNTYLSIAACTVVTFVLSALVSEGKFEMEHVQNSTLAGGVGVGSVCNLHIGSGGAILIGMFAAFISVFGYSKVKPFFIRKFRLLDTCGVMHLHGFPGVYSGILSIFFAMVASEDHYGTKGLHDIYEAREHGRSAGVQALYQLTALIVTIFIGFFCGLISVPTFCSCINNFRERCLRFMLKHINNLIFDDCWEDVIEVFRQFRVKGLITKMPIFGPVPKEEQFDDNKFWEVP